ncbi:hypothetical protein ATE68_01975 [Sphingopyxis sp. H038]|uniref:DUF1294 domain-containing protein n=1 Tax=unclassified Sphingopyxis TaxID=2614943 RepID=UPI00072FDDE8|nr:MULTISPECIES: DUF1294 domain-containing protein [unclassified Sphingopyxis]KTE04435.1 hypothetical protein ATE78_01975 [Sphingopyxis sp. H012]KTE08156.1 hypothetical protein ATE76_16470 [Sphingopyxis sp. H093]KTE13365.1 hypothetical protein ATE70_01450 [Sphingopyxis sp. H053]KTE31204.1 hypothetical protein ATE75_01425 [Sphingopyxis sp. H080]KTE36925.1 hypothetical protein ATE68_01975 [Sphingopyxis sp. H038]
MTAYIPIWLGTTNGIAFALMVLDKKFAKSGARRISETTLLGWSLLGGAAGTFAASRLIRHKTRKQPFAAQMIAILFLELVVLLLWALGFLDPLIA